VLPVQPEGLTTGGEDGEVAAVPEQPVDERGAPFDEVLAVVEDEQQPLVTQVADE
jgi:hypothetical protein